MLFKYIIQVWGHRWIARHFAMATWINVRFAKAWETRFMVHYCVWIVVWIWNQPSWYPRLLLDSDPRWGVIGLMVFAVLTLLGMNLWALLMPLYESAELLHWRDKDSLCLRSYGSSALSCRLTIPVDALNDWVSLYTASNKSWMHLLYWRKGKDCCRTLSYSEPTWWQFWLADLLVRGGSLALMHIEVIGKFSPEGRDICQTQCWFKGTSSDAKNHWDLHQAKLRGSRFVDDVDRDHQQGLKLADYFECWVYIEWS